MSAPERPARPLPTPPRSPPFSSASPPSSPPLCSSPPPVCSSPPPQAPSPPPRRPVPPPSNNGALPRGLPVGLRPDFDPGEEFDWSPAASSSPAIVVAAHRQPIDDHNDAADATKQADDAKETDVDDQLIDGGANRLGRSFSFAAVDSQQQQQAPNNLFIQSKTAEWLLELGSSGVDDANVLIDEDRYTHYYRHYFYDKPHRIYMAYDIFDEPVVIVLQELTDEQRALATDIPFLRALVVTSFPVGDKNQLWYWTMIPTVFADKKKLARHVMAHLPLQLKLATTVKQITDAAFPACFLDFESQVKGGHNCYKFGLVYCEQDQLTERDMYSNTRHSADFDDFLDLLGERVDLHKYAGFTGGLPTSYAGQQMLLAKAWHVECVFHVSTMLPIDEEHDPDYVQRKRHIANDVAVLIFNNGSHPINPTMFVSQFVHVIIVVQIDWPLTKETGQKHYRIATASKYGCHSLRPAIPDPPVFPANDRLRLFLLSKLVNSERSAMYLPNFQSRVSRTFNFNMRELAKRFLPKRPKQLKSTSSAAAAAADASPLVADAAQREIIKRQMKEAKKRGRKSTKPDLVVRVDSPAAKSVSPPSSPPSSPPTSPRQIRRPIEPQDREAAASSSSSSSSARSDSASRLSTAIRRSSPMIASPQSFSMAQE